MKKLSFAITIFGFLLATSALAQMPNTLSKSEKVYGLSLFWQEVNYNFVYLSKVDREAWNTRYRALIDEVQETEDDYQYYRLLQAFCAMLSDGHTNVYFPQQIQEKLFNTHFGEYRLFLTNIDGKAIITRVNPSKKSEIPIGTEIVAVNGMSATTYRSLYVKPYISSSTAHILEDWSVMSMFESPEGTVFDVDIVTPKGEKKRLKLTHQRTQEQDVYPTWDDWQLLQLTWPEKGVAHLKLNSFSDPAIDSMFYAIMPELRKAKKLIIDLRLNGGGSSEIGGEILKNLTNDSVLFGSTMRSRQHIPSYKAWGNWVEAADTVGNEWARKSYLAYRDEMYYDFEYSPDTIYGEVERLVLPTVLLIGHNTASAAEDFLIWADGQKHMTKIGEPTFGSTGQPMLIDLPGGGTARICTKQDRYPDGREFVGVGILPDILVETTIDDYQKNRDVGLEKALEFLKKK
ncbi:MAG: peptidase S41 [Cryomorphaceae bacterium]|nr:peptidase S41 [Cryomorphaceae bacterium]